MLSNKHLTTSLLVILFVLTALNGWVYLHKLMSDHFVPRTIAFANIETPAPIASIPIPQFDLQSPLPLDNIQTTEITEQNTPQPSSKATCNTKTDVCLANLRTVYSLQEGYQEYDRYWVNSEIALIGQGQGGFEISWQGAPEVKLHTSTNNFNNDQQLPIFLMVEKDVTKKGQYQGKIVIKTYLSNKTNEFPITINYVDPNLNMHADTQSIEITCLIDKKQFNGYVNCGDYNQVFYFKVYWWGKHKAVEIRTVSQSTNNSNVGISARFANLASSTADIDTLAPIYIDFFHNSQYISQWEESEHKGEFIFVDQSTQQELLKVPYLLRIKLI